MTDAAKTRLSLSLSRACALALLGAGLSVGAGFGCDDANGGDVTAAAPPPASRTDPFERRLTETSSAADRPVLTKVRPSAPGERIHFDDYRGGGGGGSARRPPGYPRGRVMTAEEAQEAARAARGQELRRGAEPCELAYDALAAVGREYRSKTPGGNHHALDHDRFIEDCELRPEPMQWCMVPSYIAQHADECDREAHTRYQRAIERNGGADDGFFETGEPAPPTPRGPQRLGGEASSGEEEETACPDGDCGQ